MCVEDLLLNFQVVCLSEFRVDYSPRFAAATRVSDTDPDLDPAFCVNTAPDPGFHDKKLKKIFSKKEFHIFSQIAIKTLI